MPEGAAGPSTNSTPSSEAIPGPGIGLSDQQINDMTSAFEMFDLDKDGRITEEELHTVMNKLRINVSDDEIKEMIQRVDIDGNGTIELSEFIQMMSTRLLKQSAISEEERVQCYERETLQAFHVFDRNGDGLIDSEELKQTMRNLGEEISDDDVVAMIRTADANGDGKVDYNEFTSVMNRRK